MDNSFKLSCLQILQLSGLCSSNDDVAERSKARGSGPRLARGVGSNPTVVNRPFRPPLFSALATPVTTPFPFLPFSRRPLTDSRGLSPGLPEFHPFRTGLFEAVSRPEARRRRASSPHTLLLLSRCAQALARCSTSRQVPVRKRKERAKETSLRVRRTSLAP